MLFHRLQMRRLRQGHEIVCCYWAISQRLVLTRRLGVVRTLVRSRREGVLRNLKGNAMGLSSHQSFPILVNKDTLGIFVPLRKNEG